VFRYLKEAFWFRPSMSGVGRVPWNALALGGAAVLGIGEPAVWLAALGAETLYLYLLASNPRFQKVVDAMELERVRGEVSTVDPTETLSAPLKARVAALEEKITRVEKLYRQSEAEDYLADTNLEALRKLVSIYARLLVARRNIEAMGDPAAMAAVRAQIARLREELAQGVGNNTALRESKEATLRLCTQRLQNYERRDQSLAEIESDLTRIETQIDLALEDASLRGRPSAITSNIDLVSHLLIEDPETWTASTSAEVEN
jgi:hypothetical protein